MDKKVTLYKDIFEFLCRNIESELNKVADRTLDEMAPVVHATTKNYTDYLLKVLFDDEEGD